jgi:two-component system LytT family response regulator
MRTVIIDDEAKGRQTLKNFIVKYAPQLEVIGEANDVNSGIALIEKERPGLVFLDIQMPDGTGFDLLGQVMFTDFKLIFCTSYDQYAVKAFRFSAIDYLLKPIDPDVFKAAVEKAMQNNIEESKKSFEVLSQNKMGFKRIALHSAEGISLVDIAEIIRCESSVNYTRIVMKDGSNVLVTKTLKEYDEMLSEHRFIRVHKSFLVNLLHIKKYLKGEGGWVIMSDGSKIEVSRRKKEVLLEVLADL